MQFTDLGNTDVPVKRHQVAKILKNLQSFGLWFCAGLLMACQASNPPIPSSGHLNSDIPQHQAQDIPPMVTNAPVLPPPTLAPELDRFTVVADSVPVKELLFSVARDAALNLDIEEGIDFVVTLNAINQTLPSILERLSQLTPIKYDIIEDRLVVSLDKPYFKSYRVSYLNMNRETTTSVSVATQISSTGQGAGAQGSGGENNNSQTSVTNSSQHQFWGSLEANIRGILRATQRQNSAAASQVGETQAAAMPVEATSLPMLSSEAEVTSEAAPSETEVEPLVMNREAGIVGVTATQRQHHDIEKFLTEIMRSVQRQVLIEATIAEVTLSDQFQAGIDWQMLENGDLASLLDFSNTVKFSGIQDLTGADLESSPFNFFRLTDTDFYGKRLDMTLKALETFGDVEVMSSPKLMALNNQTAMLKVVDNLVYFSIEVDTQISENGGLAQTEFETNIHTIPVGLVMSVTPYIDEHEQVTLNVRPTISRIIGQVQDPNPLLAQANVVSEIPVVQVREIESILKVNNGDIAVIGGLMQDDVSKSTTTIPVLGQIPILKTLFTYKEDTYTKTELVIFIRPVVINEPSLGKDFSEYREFLAPSVSDLSQVTH